MSAGARRWFQANQQGGYRFATGRAYLQMLTRGKFLHVIARSAATWQSASPAAGHDRKQYFGRIRKSATDLPKVVPTCQVSLRGRGLPHQCAHWFAMTCRRQRRVCGCKAVVPGKPTRRLQVCHWAGVLANVDTRQISACHCEERSDVAIRIPCGRA